MSDNSIDRDVTMPIGQTTTSGRPHAGDEILGRYVVQSELGQGGMGVVYKCLDKVGGVEVAVKGLPPDVSHNADEMEEIRDNFQLVCDLRHPGIAGVRTLERDAKGDYYLVMDVAHGVNLTRWIKAHRNDDFAVKLALLAEMAAALDYAHSKRVMHRDMKPENVMVDPEGHVQILDFGLAARIRTSMSRVSMRATSMSGTPGYKSPEQWRGQPQGAAADQYALGVIAYKMISGELPFDSDDLSILREAVLKEPVPEIPDVPPSVNRALARALAKTPGERFANCADFIAVLGGGKASGKPVAPAAKTQKVVAPSRPFPVRIVVAALVALVVLAGGGFAVSRWSAARSEQARQRAEAIRLRNEELARKEAERKAAEAARKAAEAEAAKKSLRNAAIEVKARAGTAREDIERRGYANYPELAASLRSFNACYESGLEAFKNGDYAAATNFFERSGAFMREMAAEQRRIDAEKAERERVASVRRKVATGGYDEGKDADGRVTAVWVPGREVNGRKTSDREGVWRVQASCPICNGNGEVSRRRTCQFCQGRGTKETTDTCSRCNGNKTIEKQVQSGSSNMVRVPCSAGCGQITRNGMVQFQHGFVCSQCNGHGMVNNPNAAFNALAGAAIGAALFGNRRPPHPPPPPPPQQIPCQRCNGVGGYACSTCSGRGYLLQRQEPVIVTQNVNCPDCAGSGTHSTMQRCSHCQSGKVSTTARCSHCDGHGRVWVDE